MRSGLPECGAGRAGGAGALRLPLLAREAGGAEARGAGFRFSRGRPPAAAGPGHRLPKAREAMINPGLALSAPSAPGRHTPSPRTVPCDAGRVRPRPARSPESSRPGSSLETPSPPPGPPTQSSPRAGCGPGTPDGPGALSRPRRCRPPGAGPPRGARAPRRGHPGLTCGAPAAVHRKHPRLGSRRPECFGSGRARASVRFSAPPSAPNTHARARAFCRRKITTGMRCLSRRNVTSPKGL